MKKDRMLKYIVLLQALCLIILAFIVVYRVLLPPKSSAQLPAGDAQDIEDGSGNELTNPSDPAGPSDSTNDSIAAKVGNASITAS